VLEDLRSPEQVLKMLKRYLKPNDLLVSLPSAAYWHIIFSSPKTFYGEFDTSLSLGSIEHFKDPNRQRALNTHMDLEKWRCCDHLSSKCTTYAI